MSPVEILGTPCRAANRSACVPLPAPGGPKNTRFSGTWATALWRATRGETATLETDRRSMDTSTRVTASEPLDDHFARPRKSVLSVVRKNGQHPAQEQRDAIGRARHALESNPAS